MLQHHNPVNVTFFRDYGLHEVKNDFDNPAFIASAPNWDETFQLLKESLPKKGNVITPEYATVSHNLSQLHKEGRKINDRIQQARALTKKSDAILHLGTPTEAYDNLGRSRWLNSVLSIRRGNIDSVTHKTTLVPVEKEVGVIEPLTDLRKIKNGNAVLICAELYGLFIGNRQPEILQNSNVSRIFASTAWATPITDRPIALAMHDACGGEDNYYRQQLELVVGRYAMSIPTVRQVIVADRGRPDLPPYNAVFSRIDS